MPEPLRWSAEALWEQLSPLLPGLSVEVVARIASTNTALLERARIMTPPAEEGEAAQVRRSVESTAFGRRAADLHACLQESDPPASAPQVLARIARPLVEALRRFERAGFAAFAASFERRDMLRGRAIHTTHPDVPEGCGDGLAPDGSLRVRTPDGRVVEVSSGEVTVRLQRAGGAPC